MLPTSVPTPVTIALSRLSSIPSPSQGMLVWVKNVLGVGSGTYKLVYDPAGNGTYPWRVDDIAGTYVVSGYGSALPPNSGDWVEATGSRKKLPCPGIWNVQMAGTFDGVNVRAFWVSNGSSPPDGNAVYIDGWSTSYQSISVPAAVNLGSYSSLSAAKFSSGSGGIESGAWNAYPSRIIAP